MSGYIRRPSGLWCDGVTLAQIADSVGTPAYVYSAAAIADRYREIDEAFGGYPHAVHYALKANSTMAIVRLLRGLGSAADANSGGEIEVALRAGFSPNQIVFTGVGKTRDELQRAIALGLKTINIESSGELDRIDTIARELGTRARVAVRINPDIDAESHPHISTGLKTTKFGVSLVDAAVLCRAAASRAGVTLVGVHVHVGSQIMSLAPIGRAAAAVVSFAADLRSAGIALEHIDVGGGLGIPYDGGTAPSGLEYATTILEAVSPSGLAIVLEPGRALVGSAGALIARVVDVKSQPGGAWFVVVDAGMTELMRPALYGAYHRIEPVMPRSTPDVSCDIVGPVCETTDTLGKARRMPLPEVGDLLCIFDAGAYGSVMASNYNRRPMAAEVLVEDSTWRVIRRRQTIADLVQYEE